VNEALQKYVHAATGITGLTKNQAEKIVKQMVKQGEAARDQAGDLVEDLLGKSRENAEQLRKVVKAETQRVISSLGLASQREVERLDKQVAELKRKLAAAEQAASPPAKKTAKKTTKKATKKATKKTTKKTARQPAKKTAKKTARQPAKKTARQPAKKAAKKTARQPAKKTAKRSS